MLPLCRVINFEMGSPFERLELEKLLNELWRGRKCQSSFFVLLHDWQEYSGEQSVDLKAELQLNVALFLLFQCCMMPQRHNNLHVYVVHKYSHTELFRSCSL